MTDLTWIADNEDPGALPPAEQALESPNGLLAAGGNLSPEWLLSAYRRGIFPWFERGQPILWWSPDPRAVLKPESLRVSRSLRRTIKRQQFSVSADTAFEAVIVACSGPRSYTDSTWITPSMRHAFTSLHELGWAHSFEAWQGGQLAGGLYGISIGQVFFGESMFSRVSNASKVAFVAAVDFFKSRGIALIDCQIPSTHLSSLGAVEMSRPEFLHELNILCAVESEPARWSRDFADQRARAIEAGPRVAPNID